MEARTDNAQTATKRAEIDSDIWAHYDHACEKHPFFADDLCSAMPMWDAQGRRYKEMIVNKVKDGEKVMAHWVLLAELCEIFAAAQTGDFAQARYEVLDAIAVLLRMDDMLANHK